MAPYVAAGCEPCTARNEFFSSTDQLPVPVALYAQASTLQILIVWYGFIIAFFRKIARRIFVAAKIPVWGSVSLNPFGAENQAEIHYAVPVKNNLYDALEYAGQVEEAAKSHRKEMKRKKEQGEASADEDRKMPSAGEFLSGFWAEDRLIPSITVTVFFGSEEWDGPLSLFDMMDVSDPEVLACMDNYHVRLIAPAQMADEEIMKFQSSLREVMLFIKYSKDKENLSRVLAANERRFRELERRAADVIEAITNLGIKYDESEEVIDVCQAIQEIRMEERKIGEQDGELKKAKEDARNFYNLGVDIEKIAQGVGYAVETVKEWLGLGQDI